MSGGYHLGIPGLEDEELVGRGAFSVVVRANQPAFRRVVAVKVLTLTRLDDEARRRFSRECQAMGALSDHPAIVTVHDAGFTDEERPYLIMAYVPGGSLADRLDEHGAVGWEDAFRIGVRLAGGLETAHRAGILHRDLKPANVLVSPFGEQLTDFGIARIAGAVETRTGLITASPAYAAPEILSGEKPTVGSDVYSLGATLFEIIAGEPAFVRDTDESIMPLLLRINQEPVPDLRARGVPADVAAVLEQAMSKDPARRPATALDLGRQLQRVQRSHGLRQTPLHVAGEPPLLEPAADAPRAADVTATRSEIPPPTPAGATGPRWRWLRYAAAAILALALAGVAVALATRSDPQDARAAPTLPATAAGPVATVPPTTTPPAPTTVAAPATTAAAGTTPPRAATTVLPDLARIEDPLGYLAAEGFEVRQSSAFDDVVPAGSVISQQPAAGAIVPSGSTVEVVVSQGPLLVVAFDTNRDGNTEIYSADAAGTELVRLTTGRARDSGATWSPDGSRIAFASDRSGGDEIYVMQADGSEQVRLTSTPGSNASPAWSPVGDQLAFTSSRDGDLEIYVMGADGTGARRLTASADRDFGPAWAPDGSQIAFGSERDGLVQVWTMNADGSNQRRLTAGPGRNFDPAWSPDGELIAFVSDRDGDNEIYVMRSDGTGQRNVSNEPESSDEAPVWSPDGAALAFVSDRTGDLEVFVMDPAGGSARNLTNAAGSQEAAPTWSPAAGPAG